MTRRRDPETRKAREKEARDDAIRRGEIAPPPGWRSRPYTAREKAAMPPRQRRTPPLEVVRGQGRAAPGGMSRRTQLATMPTEFMLCRVGVGNHSINPGSYQLFPAPGGGWTLWFTCAVCGTKITKNRDRHGFVQPGSYSHPKGYLMAEGGRLTQRERAQLFLRLAGAKT